MCLTFASALLPAVAAILLHNTPVCRSTKPRSLCACYTLCSNKQQQNPEAEHDPQFDPVIKLEHQVEVKTHEEDEDVQFKMYVTC